MSFTRTYRTNTPRQYRYPVWLENKTADDWEGGVNWQEDPLGNFYADIRPKRYRIIQEGTEETIVDKFEVYVPWRPGVSIYGDFVQRFRTEQVGLYYYIESVVDLGATSREFEVICTQRLEAPPSLAVPIIPGGQFWINLQGQRVVRLGG